MSGTTSNEPVGYPFFEQLEPRLLLSAGDLDPTFGVGGLVITYIGTSDYGRSVAVQEDGKIVVAGESGSDFAVTRYKSDGSLDSAFDYDGKVTTDFGGTSDIAWDIAIQADGKIVVAGHAGDDFALVRYNPNGSLDTSFDSDGKVTTDFGSWNDWAYSVAIQTDGKIVVAGESSGDFALVRYNSDGSLDTTFGAGGLVTTDFAGLADVARSIAIQADGRIVLGGCSGNDFALARYNSDGSLDTAFDSDGKVTTDFAGSVDYGYSLAIQPDGNIVVAGRSYQGATGYDFALARYNSDGSLDSAFDVDGKVTTDFGGPQDWAYSVAVQANQRIVLAGHAGDDFALARYNGDGTLDTTFGGDGRVTTDFMGTSDDAFSVAIQADGKIVVAGRVYRWGGYDFALARYDAESENQTPVANADGPYTINEGDALSLDASASSDGDDDTLTFSWDLNGDGDFADAAGATPTVAWSDLAALGIDDDGSYDLTVRVDDGNGGVDEAPGTLTIGNVAPTIALSGAAGVDEGSPYTLTLGVVTDPGDDTIVATGGYTVHWGDGSSDTYDAPGDVMHTYADGPATPTITVDLVDEDGAHTAAGSLGLTVNNVAPTIDTFTVPATGVEGTPIAVSATASDPAGANDTLSYAWTVLKDGAAFAAGAGVSFSFTPDDNAGYQLDLEVSDGDGGLATSTATVNVGNVAPTIALSGAAGVDEGSPYTLTLGAVTDPGDDTIVATGGYTVHWGDGSSDTYDAPGDVMHTYADGPATPTITVDLVDEDGAHTAAGSLGLTVNNLPDLSGFVFDDLDNDGIFDEGETGVEGVAVTLTGDDDQGAVNRTAVTDAGGAYIFDDLRPGTYTLTEGQPGGLLDGDESVGILGGTVDNTQDSNVISGIVVQTDDPDAPGYNFAEIRPSEVVGMVWQDFNDDGEINFGETVIEGAAIALTGTDDRGNAVNVPSAATDVDGIYMFFDLRPGNYTMTEDQPIGFEDGKDSLGTVNGVPVGDASVNDQFSAVVLSQPDSVAQNYNFGERTPTQDEVIPGQTATIGFWQNKNGQNLIKSLNGGANATQLGNWLAATFPNMYGASAGANNLTGKSNAEVADFYSDLFRHKKKEAVQLGLGGPAKMDAQVMAVALATYVTNETLAGTVATSYGFVVTENGLGVSTFNVGTSGDAFGVADYSDVSILDLLVATNDMTVDGLLYDLDGDGDADDDLESLLRTLANDLYTTINEQGDI